MTEKRHIDRFPIWGVALCLLLVQCQSNNGDLPTKSVFEQSIEPEKTAVLTENVKTTPWKPLNLDGVHDPANAVLSYLQEPDEALSLLSVAPEPGGNNVDWVEALESGLISPRSKIQPDWKVNNLDLDIIMPNTAGMPQVVFPHRQHTEWLDCSNCHDKIFKAKTGANQFGMLEILQGEYCGRCHGAVSFPLTQCLRCHSRDHDQATLAK